MGAVVPISAELRARREELLTRHLAAHNRGDVDGVIATFSDVHLELVASNRVLQGNADVAAYLRGRQESFPDAKFELITLFHADDAVVCEYWMSGTLMGDLRDMAATGKRFRARMCSVYRFDGADLVGQRVYYDTATIVRQLA